MRTIILLLVSLSVFAQPVTHGSTGKGIIDYTNATSTRPIRVVTSDPVTAVVGEMILRSDLPVGSQLRYAPAINTWSNWYPSTLADTASSNDFTGTNNSFGLGTSGLIKITVLNETVTGTATGGVVKFTADNPIKVVSVGIADTEAIGICISGCGTTGSALIAVAGWQPCTFSNTAVAGHFAQISTATGNNCLDVGATRPTSGSTILGQIKDGGAAGLHTVALKIEQPISSTLPTQTSKGNQFLTTDGSAASWQPSVYPLYTGVSALTACSGANQDLVSYSIPAATLAVGDRLEYIVSVFRTIVASGNGVVPTVLFGATAVNGVGSTGGGEKDWHASGFIVVTGATAQFATGLNVRANNTLAFYPNDGIAAIAPAETISGAIVFKVRVNCVATADNNLVSLSLTHHKGVSR